MSPKISVLIPIWRLEPRLFVECIASLNRQTLGHDLFEVVICYDGTPDREIQIATESLKALEAASIVIRSPAQIGMGPARNMCASASTAEWLTLLDHDDQFEPASLQALLDATDTSTDLVYSNYSRVDPVQFDELFVSDLSSFDILMQSYGMTPDSPLLHCTHILQAMLIRSRTFASAGGFDNSAGLAHEVDLRIRLNKGNNFKFLNESLYRYVQRTGSTYHTRHAELVRDTCSTLSGHFSRVTRAPWKGQRLGKLDVSDVTIYGHTGRNGGRYATPWVDYSRLRVRMLGSEE